MLLDAASPLVPRNRGADMIRASPSVRGGNFLLRLAGCQGYASQWPLPDTTQDSVHGCWLGFAVAAITGD